MDRIEVEIVSDRKGRIIPRWIWHGGHRLAVTSTGRRWLDEAGEHILCQISDGRVFEIVHQLDSMEWQLGFCSPETKSVI